MTSDTLYCSFCGKTNHETRRLIAGPQVFICDECVFLCLTILINTVDRKEMVKEIRNLIAFVQKDNTLTENTPDTPDEAVDR